MKADLENSIRKLVGYCEDSGFAGYDPYDALNSRLLQTLPFLNSRIPGLVLTQILKRSPINVRSLALIPKTQNPKALALFLSSFLELSELDFGDQEPAIRLMVDRLDALRSPGFRYWCWGYSFPWQGRAVRVKAGEPNLVCTTFVASALLDAYEKRGYAECLTMAVSAAEYIRNELFWSEGSAAGFSYPLPSVRAHIHNANFLAAALLCRVHRHTGEEKFLSPALEAARYSAEKQREDGSWYYGELPGQHWIDNFHTGYNLCALRAIAQYTGTIEFEARVHSGFDYYRKNFLLQDGSVKYFHDKLYPIDIHCVAQSMITLLTLKDLDRGNVLLAQSVWEWAMDHMWDDRGFFYYRVLRYGTIRTSYMRWSQAWMLLAMTTLVRELSSSTKSRILQNTLTPA